MANRDRDSDSDDAKTIRATASSHNTVFIDTSLDTHLALIVSDTDTVAHLKKKIVSEHPQCFPNIGEIKIHAIKVKRKRCFYHLSDSMLVKSAFVGAKKCWFLSVDAFSIKKHDNSQFPIEPDVRNKLALICFTKTPSGDLCTSHPGIISPVLSSGKTIKEVLNDMEMKNMEVDEEPSNTSFLETSMRSDLGEIPRTQFECSNGKSKNMNGDVHCDDSVVEDSKSRPSVKKKRKRESKGAESPSEENEPLLSGFSEETCKPKVRILENPVQYKLNNTTGTSDPLFTEFLEDVHLVASSTSGKKKITKKVKLPRDQAITIKPSSLHDVGKESFNEKLGIVAKNSDKASDVAIVSEHNVQHATLSGTFEVSPKQKHPEPVQEIVECGNLPSTAIDILPTEPPEDVHLVASSDSRKKKIKRKIKLSRDQEVTAEPSFLHDVGKETITPIVGIVAKDSDKGSHAAIVSEQNTQQATLSGTFELSQKQKHPEPVQVMLKSDKLPPSSIEDVHLVASSTSGKKKIKRKIKLPKDHIVTAEPSSLSDVGKETIKENVENVAEDSDKAADAAIVSEQNVQHEIVSGQNTQHETLSQTFEVSKKKKNPEPVQEVVEGDKFPSSSLGVNTSGPDAANGKGKSDAPELGARSGSKGRKNSKKKQSTDVKEFPSLPVNEFDILKQDVTRSRHESIVPDDQDDHKIETSHPHKIEERRELPQNHGPEAVLSEKCEPLIQGEADMHHKAKVVSANFLETNTAMESGKSAGSRRMKMSAKKSVAAKRVMSSMEHGDNSSSGISSHVHHSDGLSSGEAKKDESYLSLMERKKISKPKTLDNSFVGANGQSDDMSGNEAEFLPQTQINKTQENAETIDGNFRKKAKKKETFDAKTFADFPVKEQTNELESLQLNQIKMNQKNGEKMDDKQRKKTERSQNSLQKSLPDLPIKEQEVGGEALTPSNDRHRDVDTPSKTKRKAKSVKNSSKSQLTGQELELEKYRGSFNPQQNLRTVDSTQVASLDTLESNSTGRPLQNGVDGNPFKNSNMIVASNRSEVSKCDGDSVNFKDYFVPGEHTHEIVPVELVVDKVSEAKRSDKEVKTKRNAINLVVPSLATSLDQQNSLKPDVNQESERRSHGVKAPDSQGAKQIKIIPQESKQPGIVNSSKTGSSFSDYPKENGKSSRATNSSSESCDEYLRNKKETKHQTSLDHHHATVSKDSNKKMGEVVNSSRHEKSLLATPRAIFRDGSSESSENGSSDANSDSSTRTPSDNSSSSGYAEVESKSNPGSPKNGIRDVKGKDGGKSIISSRVSGAKNITMDAILRSSSRFKKAKLTATQSQLEDTESQPIDFVPDSQGNL